MISTGTVSYALQRNALRRAEADSIADFVMHRAVLALLDQRVERRWRVDGVPQKMTLLGIPVTVVVQDVFGLIDLNEADISVFERLFQSEGLADDEAARLAVRLVDWRSANTPPAGTTAEDYRLAGSTYAPRHAPLQSVGELRLVLGMSPELFRRVAPALTVHSRQPNADPATAPREVLLSFPGASGASVDEILARRASNPGTYNAEGLLLSAGIIEPETSIVGRAFAIAIRFTHAGTAVHRTAVVRLTGDPSNPMMMLEWNELQDR
jgi:general secretion pathway protein K